MRTFVGYSTVGINNPQDTKFTDLELIKRDLLNEFHTKKGERVMFPTFGSVVWDVLFEPMIESNKNKIIEDSIRIINDDGRVEFLQMDILETQNGIALIIQIKSLLNGQTEYLYIDFIRNAADYRDGNKV
jgi:phage baseplate assembly protein W